MSLRSRLLGLALLATLLPALLLGWRFVRDSEAEITAAVHRLAGAAGGIARDLDHRVKGTAQLHYGLAHSRQLDGADRAACSDYLAEVRGAYPQYTGILTVRADGRLHCDSLRSGRSLDLRDRAYFRRAVAGAAGPIVEPAFGRLTGHSVLQIVHPVRDEAGALRYALVASLNLTSFVAQVHGAQALADTELLLVDDRGLVMAWTGPRGDLPAAGSSVAGQPVFALARRGGTGEIAGPDGRAQVWAVAVSPAITAAGLHVMLGQPREALVAAARARLHQELAVLAGAALLLFVSVGALAEWGIRRPVVRITSMVSELGAGRLDARIAGPHPRGELGGLMAVLNDTAASLQRQRAAIDDLAARLARMANFDSLTGLPNRSLFRDRLQQALVRSRRSGRPLAVMFLDIDRFKNINDSLGHEVGDRLLLAVSAALAGCVRASDSVARDELPRTADEVFRLGGDEFMVLAEDVRGTEAVAAIAQRILDALQRPFAVGEHELFITASIGIAMGGGHDEVDLDGLIRQADLAMYRAKELGRDTWCFFDEAMNRAAAERHHLEVLLRRALERDEFRLVYQPKADLADGRVTGVEALLRWHPAGQPVVAPDRFIGILEETGLIVPVGAWVLREACSQMKRWQAAGLRPIDLAVNLSARQFRHEALSEQIAAVLTETGFDPKRLELELTESMLIEDSDAVVHIMAGLAALGVRVAIDDFGTGQSSLRYLKRFNLDTLKIDRSFVRDTPGDTEDSAIAAAVIALGHSLGLNVVAEGVETAQQVDFLHAQGCDQIQGYLLSRPLDADAFAQWLGRREVAPQAELAA